MHCWIAFQLNILPHMLVLQCRTKTSFRIQQGRMSSCLPSIVTDLFHSFPLHQA